MATNNDRNPPHAGRAGGPSDNVIPFARPRRTAQPSRRARLAVDAPPTGLDDLLDGPLALAVGDMLARPRAQDRVCAVALMHVSEYRLLEEGFGEEVARELDGLIQGRVHNLLQPTGLAVRVEELRARGITRSRALCERLLEGGAPGLHFYTMNQSAPTLQIWDNLDLPAAT